MGIIARLLGISGCGNSQLLIVCVGLVASLGVCGYSVAFIFLNANWVLGDAQLTLSNTVMGSPAPTLFAADVGRFLPLALQEFNLFLSAGNAPYLYYAWQALKLGVTFLILGLTLHHIQTGLFRLDRSPVVVGWLGICGLLMLFATAPRVFSSYANFIFTESTILVFVSLFVYFYLRALETERRIDYVLSLVAGNCAIYLKEPVFGSLIVAVLVPYLFNRAEFSRRRKLYTVGVVASGSIYLLLYYLIVFQNVDGNFYNSGRNFGQNRLELTWSAALAHPLLFVLGVVALMRLASLVTTRNREAITYDGLLFAGLSYFVAFLILNMRPERFFPPVYAFVIPSLFFYFLTTLAGNRRTSSWPAIATFVLLLGILLPLQFQRWKGEIEGSQARRINEVPQLLKLGNLARGRTIHLLGANNIVEVTRWYADVLNGFLNIYGFESHVEHSYDWTILRDVKGQLVILISPEVRSETELNVLLEDANFRHISTFWVGLRLYTNFQP